MLLIVSKFRKTKMKLFNRGFAGLGHASEGPDLN